MAAAAPEHQLASGTGRLLRARKDEATDMNKLPRREVLEEQARAVQAAEAELDEGDLEEVSGGLMPMLVLMYGIGLGVIRKLME